ncbi:aminodeoxychorismate synthase component I [Mycolicibacterium komossense]|uniref:Aminodeoxychorismate synthase component I n=1 Tax=Mycolicibacterium komossense TaxID=1779 RepID=A0ABT3CE91_9MYCO|nr:aminodeoxychorismate synthase component I [Mycolicibacterium komossense]MCV7227798.1 aminodeoxychorismate synthase component I [Mycolicibacterium komossense]
MRIDRLGAVGTAPRLLRAVARAAQLHQLAPPAALTGEWFGARAVIAPSVDAAPTAPDDVFTTGPGIDAEAGAIGGGWVGYLSYPDAGADGRPGRIPVAAGGWTDCVLRQDSSEIWWYESLSGAPMPHWLADAVTDDAPAAPWRIDWSAPNRDVHRSGVAACLDAIVAGEVYQACVCTQFTGSIHGSPLDFFADAVARTAPARGAYVAGAWGAVASLSPEVFLVRRGDTVVSSPIKGTLPLHADPAQLRASVKDVAENIMIVDLVRNDLGRVAVTGSVGVPELLAVRPAPGVWHLVSTVSSQVPAELTMHDLLSATFPPASVTGTPKGRARELLSQWEPRRRGVYCGTVGLASPLAGTELNVAIRTVEFDSTGAALLGVGGGITADSDVDAEWQECLDKAAATIGLGASTITAASEAPHRRARGATEHRDAPRSPAGTPL